MPRHDSYDALAERLLLPDALPPAGNRHRLIRELVQEARDYACRSFSELPKVDEAICRLYYLEKLTQDEIGRQLGISRAAVGGRLKSSKERLRLLMSRPSLDPLRVGPDFEALFPPDLMDFAYFFYFEISPSRVMCLLRVSESCAADKLKKVLAYLKRLAALPEHGPYDPAALKEARMIGADRETLSQDAVEQKRHIAVTYLDFFQYMKDSRVRMSHIDKTDKNSNPLRKNSRLQGPSIF